MSLNYKAPILGEKSSIDGEGSDQMRNFFWIKKSLIEAKKEQYFTKLAKAIDLPKHYGKTVKVYEYVPVLDDRNINDQGIDAQGATIQDGNLYGSSKDIGYIQGKLPVLGENGGKVNRIGFTRLQLESSIHKMGYHYDFTAESLAFDSDSQLKEHLARETINAATQMYEALLQMDLLAGAGVVVYPGAATTDEELTGEGDKPSVVTYEGLMRLDQILTDNRTPRHTKIITGSTKVDTRTISSARILYVGSEIKMLLRGMTDMFGNKAFIEVHHYADAANVLDGEIGSIDSFRIIEVPEMLHWAGAGAEVTDNPGYRTSVKDGKERYDVYPMLVVGNESFSTIGFQTGGESVKFDIITKMPGRETADRVNDPFGESGFSSIKWYYGTLITRPERIGLYKTVAPI